MVDPKLSGTHRPKDADDRIGIAGFLVRKGPRALVGLWPARLALGCGRPSPGQPGAVPCPRGVRMARFTTIILIVRFRTSRFAERRSTRPKHGPSAAPVPDHPIGSPICCRDNGCGLRRRRPDRGFAACHDGAHDCEAAMRAQALAHAIPLDQVDLEALDRFLMSDRSPPDCMMLSDLDGFLTGIAIGRKSRANGCRWSGVAKRRSLPTRTRPMPSSAPSWVVTTNSPPDRSRRVRPYLLGRPQWHPDRRRLGRRVLARNHAAHGRVEAAA